ncbi:MAG TPA: response regulator transcription factor [Gaiellaceae bacterium]|nr:response regulator transcription factor [Gaiellaceae bacterium]
MSDPVAVVIADDHPLFRRGLRASLEGDEGIVVVGEAETGEQAVSLALELQPEVVVMDLQMPSTNGVDATREIVRESPHIGVLVVTMFEDDDSVFAAMRAGARGYLLKGADNEQIVRAVRTIAAGEAIFGAAVATRLIAYFAASPSAPTRAFPQLTARERDVLELIAQGCGNPEIARRLVLSPKTVRNHVSNIFSKLHVLDRAEAIIKARDAGLGRAIESERT